MKLPYRNFLALLSLLAFREASTQTIIGGTVNIYTEVAIIGPCQNKVTVNNPAGFTGGNSVILIQMQGASMDETSNTAAFGTLTSYNHSGLWEKAVIQSVVGNVVTFTKNLLNDYTESGKVQMVLLPTYTDATVNTTLTGDAWNGSTGGVIAIEVTGTLTLNANIDATAIGFRGGSDLQDCNGTCNFLTSYAAFYYPAGDWRAGYKGEGIVPLVTNKERGKGRQVNGGGSGNAAANGGGGGGNYAAGGAGGNNNEPGAFLCKGSGNFGLGGSALSYADNIHLFLGGGGGAGHGDNGVGSNCPGNGDSGEGGNGGGIVIIIANNIVGNGFSIISKGGEGDESWGDGAGGGGAGGTVLLRSNSYTGNLTVDVSGGDGGDSNNTNANRCFGSGGGGGAGIVLTGTAFPANVTVVSNGGARGFIINSSTTCNNTSNAVDGAGTTDILIGVSIRQGSVNPAAGCGLPVTFIHFSGEPIRDKIMLKWATATELDADYFSVERSFNNSDFIEIGRVTAAGNTSTRTDYSFLDELPFRGVNYYRLRQVDVTGYEKHTPVISVSPDIHRLVKSIYPNPLKSRSVLHVLLTDAEKEHRLDLLDVEGRIVSTWYRKRQPDRSMQLNLPALLPGVYLLVVESQQQRETYRIVVE